MHDPRYRKGDAGLTSRGVTVDPLVNRSLCLKDGCYGAVLLATAFSETDDDSPTDGVDLPHPLLRQTGMNEGIDPAMCELDSQLLHPEKAIGDDG